MTILTVGAGGSYATLRAAIAASHDGDVLQVKAGVYTNDFATINTRITIEGIGGMVQLVATVPPPDGKAILTINTDVTIDHLEFSGARVADGNGAGIRYQGGNLVINNSYFHNNQDGLLAASDPAGSITITNSEFAYNGTGDGRTHNIYVNEVGTLRIADSYFHNSYVGHEIKSRAFNTIIDGNRISEGPTGTGSYSIDVPEGGHVTITNNTIEQGPKSQNPAIVHVGNDGPLHPGTTINIANNTILNDLRSPSASLLLNQSGSGAGIVLSNNRVWGLTAAQMLQGPGTVTGTVVLAGEPGFSTAHPFTGGSSTPPVVVPPVVVPPVVVPPVVVPKPPVVVPKPPIVVQKPPVGGPTTPTSDTLVLNLSNGSWQSGVKFIASVDGKALAGAQTVAASHDAGMSQAFTFTGSFGTGAHTLTIDFLKEGPGAAAATQRLFVDTIQFDGHAVAGAATNLAGGGVLGFALTSPATQTPADSLVRVIPGH